MTDGQTLFVVFAALYLIESLRWLPVRAWVCAGSGRNWTLRQPWRQLQAVGRALTMLPVTPPVPAHLVGLPWLLVPQAAGVLVADEDEGQPELVPWANLAPHCEGATVFLTAHQRLRLPRDIEARATLEMLGRWHAMDQTAREQDFLAMAERSLDTGAMRQLAEQLAHHTRALHWLSFAIFLWCFGVIAGVYWWLGDSIEVLIAAAGLLLLQWTQAALFWRAGKSSLGAVKHRFWKTLAIACLPQAAMRAPDAISKAVAASAQHPLAARELIDEQSWLQLARRYWKDARYGPEGGDSLMVRALQTFFAQQQVDTAPLEPVPERQTGSAAYCPRCLAQFREEASICADCGGVALKQWGL